jgi:hypothetical protein
MRWQIDIYILDDSETASEQLFGFLRQLSRHDPEGCERCLVNVHASRGGQSIREIFKINALVLSARMRTSKLARIIIVSSPKRPLPI